MGTSGHAIHAIDRGRRMATRTGQRRHHTLRRAARWAARRSNRRKELHCLGVRSEYHLHGFSHRLRRYGNASVATRRCKSPPWITTADLARRCDHYRRCLETPRRLFLARSHRQCGIAGYQVTLSEDLIPGVGLDTTLSVIDLALHHVHPERCRHRCIRDTFTRCNHRHVPNHRLRVTRVE